MVSNDKNEKMLSKLSGFLGNIDLFIYIYINSSYNNKIKYSGFLL